jgi:hypothetical protein
MAETVGSLLRESREARGLTLDDAARATRIRVKYLAVIEADEFESLPSAAQARGFLRNYSEYLGLDADEVLALFDAPPRRMSFTEFARALVRPRTPPPAAPASARPRQAQDRGPQGGRLNPDELTAASAELPPPMRPPVGRARPPRLLWMRRLFSADLLVGGAVVIALLAFFAWGGTRLAGVLFSATQAATPIELGRPDDTLTPNIAPTAGAGTPTSQVVTLAETVAPPPLQALLDVPVTLQFEQTAWVLVSVDGAETFRGMVAPGNAQEYLGATSVEVLTANGAGVRVIYGGSDQGLMGGFGQIVHRIYTLGGVVTPTASPTPEVTDTLTPRPVTDTPTPRPTPSPRFSPTPTLRPSLAPSDTPRPSETIPPSPTSNP